MSSLARQVQQQQFHVEETARTYGDSGLKLTRLSRTGSKPYFATTYIGKHLKTSIITIGTCTLSNMTLTYSPGVKAFDFFHSLYTFFHSFTAHITAYILTATNYMSWYTQCILGYIHDTVVSLTVVAS